LKYGGQVLFRSVRGAHVLRRTYANWRVDDPPLNLAASIGHGPTDLAHFGLEVDSPADLQPIDRAAWPIPVISRRAMGSIRQKAARSKGAHAMKCMHVRVGVVAGVWAAHLMFELPIWQASATVRTGPGQWFAETVATFGLLLTVLGCLARAPTGTSPGSAR
jgi:hypothetical protein